MADARRLYLHIGLQKTGTSYLQAALLRSSEALAAQGLDLVPPTKRETFELMVVVRGRYGALGREVSEAEVLHRFSDQLARARGSRAVLSQESLAGANRAQVQRLVQACGDREVHVVLTVRDLARQIPSSWQESLKAGRTTTFDGFVERLREMQAARELRNPWIHLDPPAVAARWAEAVGAGRVHVVTVPPSGSAPDVLVSRFAQVLEVDPATIEGEESPGNTSLGQVQAEVLRRVNAELPEEVLRPYVYGDVVKRSFSREHLAVQDGRKALVPERDRAWCEEVAAAQSAELAAAGYDLVGTLEDLACLDSAFTPDDAPPAEEEVAAAMTQALASILTARAADWDRRRQAQPAAGRQGRLARALRRPGR